MVLRRNGNGGNVKCRACVLAMDQAAILSTQLPLHGEYSLSSDHDCLDQFSGHSLPSSYTNGGAIELRRDGALQQPASQSFSFTATNSSRLLSESGLAADSSRYKAGNNFTDSSSGSISASPSSAASSLAYNHYAQNHYTGLPTFPSTVQQSFVPSSYAGPRVAPISDGVTNGVLPSPFSFRSSVPTISNVTDRDSYPHYIPSLAQQIPSNGLHSYANASRGFFSGPGAAISSGAIGFQQNMSTPASQNYNGNHNESSQFPWPNLEVLLDLTCEGQGVTPEVHAKVEKGFFMSNHDQKWTCYRRNYFSVACNFELHPSMTNGRMYLKRNGSSNNTPEQVQAMGMRLSAAVDGSGGKSIELVQHTPKRDNGPKNKIEVVKVSPTPSSGRNEHTVSPHGVYQIPMSTFHPTGTVLGPLLPLQHSNEPNVSSATHQNSQLSPSYPYGNGSSHLPAPAQSTMHTFERVQFKQATANNGKRRASQQYFHLIVELFADVRKDGSDAPVWVKVAQRVSEKIVVRGRSPSHYQNEGQNGQAARGGGGGGGHSYNGISGGSYGSLTAGGFRTAGGYSGGVGGGAGYRASQYGYTAHSDDSASSPESVEGGAADSDHHMDTVMSESDRGGIQDYEGYQYYPSTIYESIPPQLPVPKIESGLRTATEPRHYAGVKAEFSESSPHWHGGVCGRFQGFESSRGYFPDLSVGTHGYS